MLSNNWNDFKSAWKSAVFVFKCIFASFGTVICIIALISSCVRPESKTENKSIEYKKVEIEPLDLNSLTPNIDYEYFFEFEPPKIEIPTPDVNFDKSEYFQSKPEYSQNQSADPSINEDFTANSESYAYTDYDYGNYSNSSTNNNYYSNDYDIQSSYTVYITRTGDKYHRYGCQYLRESCIAKDYNQVRYTHSPCKKCKPG